MTDLFILMLLGGAAGVIAGMLGIGGGVIIVPVLALLFARRGVAPDVLMHSAIGTSLATIVLTSVASIRAHQQRLAILWPVFRRLTPGVLLGGFTGAALAHTLDSSTLKLMFGPIMILVALQFALGQAAKPHRQLPGAGGLLVAGGFIGTLSAMLGIGGGSLSVPFLTWCNVGVRNAIATSSAIGLPIALSGMLGFVISGWGQAGRPDWSVGFVNLPAVAGIVVASMLAAPIGAWLTHRLRETTIKRIFAVFLLLLAITLLAD